MILTSVSDESSLTKSHHHPSVCQTNLSLQSPEIPDWYIGSPVKLEISEMLVIMKYEMIWMFHQTISLTGNRIESEERNHQDSQNN